MQNKKPKYISIWLNSHSDTALNCSTRSTVRFQTHLVAPLKNFWSSQWQRRTARLCMAAGVSRLLGVCDLCFADGAGLPLSTEHWMKSRHSGKKSDNLGIDAPCFLNNRLHPTWSRAGGESLGFLTGICSLFSCLIPDMARHSFYYVTKLRYGSYNTTCPPGIGVRSPEISSATPRTCG